VRSLSVRRHSFARYLELISCCAVDFEQPRALWTKVFDDTAKNHYVSNVAGHLGSVKSAEVKARQRMPLVILISSPTLLTNVLQSRFMLPSTKPSPTALPRPSVTRLCSLSRSSPQPRLFASDITLALAHSTTRYKMHYYSWEKCGFVKLWIDNFLLYFVCKIKYVIVLVKYLRIPNEVFLVVVGR
jgi:hypothetical protein